LDADRAPQVNSGVSLLPGEHVENLIPVKDTSFAEAIDSFKEFLSGQGLSSDLQWIFCEDVVFRQGRIFIKTPLPANNESRAEACYELGRERDYGVVLKGFCLLDSRPCCYIVLPEDDVDAQYMLMSNVAVKYIIRTDLMEAEPISNLLKWCVLRLLNRKSHIVSFDDQIPSRYSLLPEYHATAEANKRLQLTAR
jgi:hypothetical protein